MGSLSADDASEIADLIIRKIDARRTHDGLEFATVTAVSSVEGLVPYATVQLANDPPGVTHTVSSLIGGRLYAGLRVALLWDNPSGAYVIGRTDDGSVPLGRMSSKCPVVDGDGA